MLRSNRLNCLGLILALCLAGQSFAQMTVTGSVAGIVQDPWGQAIAGAKVTLTSERSGEFRSATTGETGAFNFVAVQPDSYTLKIEQSGFKITQHRGLVVTANEHVAVGQVQLEIGAVT